MEGTARRSGIPFAAICLSLLVTPAAASGSDHGWSVASSVGRDVLVVGALGVPAMQRDWSGNLQAGASMALAVGASEALKHIFPEERPDRNDDRSFPSGHAAVSFAAAATLENRYGWRVGLPAFALAAFVGTARVEARKHHWYDVVAGGAVGSGSGFLLTHRRDQSVRLVPWADSAGGGIVLTRAF